MSTDTDHQVSVACVGDVALSGDFLARARPAGAAATFPFEPLAPLMTGTEVLLINLEGPLGMAGPPRPGVTSLIHNEPEVLDWLRSFPKAVCTLANNHMLDYGEAALLETLDGLDRAGIARVGAGRTPREAEAMAVVEQNGLKVGFLGYTSGAPHVGSVLAGDSRMGCASLDDPSSVIESVRLAAESVDTLVVSLHWGHEYHHYPAPEQVRLARQVISAGATLVVGHHPHVQQGAESFKHGLIVHSLGNLLLPEMRLANGRVQYRKPYTKQFAILHASLGRRRVLEWSLSGGRLDRAYRLTPYAGTQALTFSEEIDGWSAPLGRPDYDSFWHTYRQDRERSLNREALRDALAKLRYMDTSTLLRQLSVADLKRNWRRLTGSQSKKQAGEATSH